MNRDTLKMVVLILLAVNLALPVAIFHFAYASITKEIRQNKVKLAEVNENNVKISAFLAGPDVAQKFQEMVAGHIAELARVMPRKIEMIQTQKIFSQIAKQTNVSIVTLKPLRDGDVYTIGGGKTPEGQDIPPQETAYLSALMQVKMRGEYFDLLNFLKGVENSAEASMAIESCEIMKTASTETEEQPISSLESYVVIKIVYAK